MIKLKIKYGNSQTDLRFPCTENEMNAALERIHAEDVTPLELYVSEVIFPEELVCLQDRFVNLDEVNFLGKRMDSFFGDEEYQFYEAMKLEGFDTLPDLINLSFNLNRYPLIRDIGDMGKIGREYLLTVNGCVPADDADDPKYAELGRELIQSGNGIFTEHGMLFVDENTPFQRSYDGQTFPPYLYDPGVLCVAKAEYGGKTEYLYFPCEEEAIDKAFARLGTTADEVKITLEDFNTDSPEWFGRFREIASEEGVYELNRLTAAVNTADMDLKKLWSVAEYAEAEDAEQLTRLARNIGCFIPTVHYDRPEIYDGVTLPDEEPETSDFAIRLLVSGTPAHTIGDPYEKAMCLSLPMETDIFNRYATVFNEADIGDCVYYGFDSVIPQITSDMFDSMRDIYTLNTLAQRISAMSETEQVKFKAALESERTDSIHDALNVAQNLWRYEFTAEPDTADAFFKKYILENTSTEFDSKWLENLLPRNEADRLLGRIGAAVTDYGVISARNGHLFKPVPYDEPEAKELKTQALTEEKLDVIEVLDRRALFSNGRLMPEQIPEGLYAYDLRHSDDGDRFCAIEPKVGDNHGGTVLMRDVLDFGESEYIPLDEDTEPNLLGDEMTPSEFAEEEAQDETMQMGGM